MSLRRAIARMIPEAWQNDALMPEARVTRVDRDTVRRRGAIAGVLARMAAREIDVLVSPFGSLDGAQRTASGMRVGGWAIDPDVVAPISVHVYSNGTYVGSLSASSPRSDVGAVFRPYGSGHGFQGTVTSRPGRQTVCAYGINTGAGGNSLLGCTSVA